MERETEMQLSGPRFLILWSSDPCAILSSVAPPDLFYHSLPILGSRAEPDWTTPSRWYLQISTLHQILPALSCDIPYTLEFFSTLPLNQLGGLNHLGMRDV